VLGQITMKLNEVMLNIGDETNLITATKVSGGVAHNIIPDRVSVSGTIRCLSLEKRALFHQQLKEFEAFSGTCMIQSSIDSASPSIINHQSLQSVAQSAIQGALGKDAIVPLIAPNMASEDFGFYTKTFPGWYYRIGARPFGGAFIPVHTSEFIADNQAIFIGASVLAKSAQLASQQMA